MVKTDNITHREIICG